MFVHDLRAPGVNGEQNKRARPVETVPGCKPCSCVKLVTRLQSNFIAMEWLPGVGVEGGEEGKAAGDVAGVDLPLEVALGAEAVELA